MVRDTGQPDSFSLERVLLRKLLLRSGSPPIQITLWNGLSLCLSEAPPIGNLVVRDRRTLAKLAINPELSFGEAYAEGRIQIEGNLLEVIEAVYRALQQRSSSQSVGSKLVSDWLRRRRANTLRGSRRNIHHHYDIRTEFYKLWLDPQLLYTCAYFPSPEDTLEAAQTAKMEYVCRKIRLRPGDRVVEAGCGWGALALHMAKHHGVRVRAFNISREQIAYARQWAQSEGLAERVEFIEDDYRNITGRYDVFVSVGMLEHVGLENYRELGRVIHRCLERTGRGFLHTIGRNTPGPLNAWIQRRIFPGAYPPTLRQMMEVLEPWGFSVLDVENLRLHYARTLEHWLERFERAARKVADMFDEEFVRSWRLYLAGSAAAFRTGSLQLFQLCFAHGSNNEIPWTRSHLYAGDPRSGKEQRWMHAMS